MNDEKLLTTPQVAEILGVTPRRVLALIKDGRLPSQQYGRDHVVKESDLKLVTIRKPGRPRKLGAPAKPLPRTAIKKGKRA